ncbi:RNA 2',3'-cyclic phosphodiesterase [Planctomycetota bacterium]
MRVFIAIDINNEIRAAISDLQQKLKADADIKKHDVKWVRPENIHLTLKFLGETTDTQLLDVCNAVEQAVAGENGFHLEIASVGYFGGGSARVLWVGTRPESDELCRLQKKIEEQLSQVGWPKEKRSFTGHLTLCRIKNTNAGAKLAQISEKYSDYNLGTISVDSVKVYQSRLTPKGPIYNMLGNYKLQ